MRRHILPLILALGLAAGAAQAAERAESAAPEISSTKAKKKQAARPKLHAQGGSSESAAERSARLRRECKGRPNAGACTGYTD